MGITASFILPPASKDALSFSDICQVFHLGHDSLGVFLDRAYLQTVPTVYAGPRKDLSTSLAA